MMSPSKKDLSQDKTAQVGGQNSEKPKIKKAKLTVFVDRRGIKVGAMITLRNGQDIRLSIDEAKELGNLLSGFY